MSLVKFASVLMLLLSCLLSGIPLSSAAPLANSVDLAPITEALPLEQQLSLLEDKTAQLGLTAAMASKDWQAIPATSLNRGYTNAAIWVRGNLHNSSDVPVTRWLVIDSPRLESVKYFKFSGDGSQLEDTIDSGNAVALAQRPVLAKQPVFPVTLKPGASMQFVLRVQSQSAMGIHATLWDAAAFRQSEGQEQAAQAFLLGLPLVLALYVLYQGVIWRDRGFLLLPLWILFAFAYICAFQGYLYRYVITGGGEWVLRAPSTLGVITTSLFAVVTMVFVGINRVPLWKWVYRIVMGLLLVGAVWTIFGGYSEGARLSNIVVACFYLLWTVSIFDAWRRGLPNARLLILSSIMIWVLILVELLQLNGVLDKRWLADWKMPLLAEAAVLMMMSMIVIGRARSLYQKHTAMQRTLVETQAQEQSRLEKAVVERTLELRKALMVADEANHAKTDFLARISHDLRTPLTSILGFAGMVQGDSGKNAERGRIIGRSATHMLTMVNDLIDYARGDNADTLQVAPVYLHALLDTIAQEGAELARRQDNQFRYQILGSLPPILQLDAKRLRRILSNLLDNAAKYTSNGSIELLVQCRATPERQDFQTLQFWVKDSGAGIAAEYQERIFEPFERADATADAPGIGLGLAIVHQWITRMQGEIHIESELGAGTSVFLALPAQIAAEEQVAHHHAIEISAAPPLLDGSGLLVLIAEDTRDIRQLLMDQLSGLGFAVEAAHDGTSAINRMSRGQGPRPDLLVTDYLMPGANGAQVLAAARRYLPGVPVVLLSAAPQALAEHQDEPLSHFDACLLKPINFIELQYTLARLLQLETMSNATEEAPTLIAPPEKVLAQARELIELGAISDLIDWSEQCAVDYPQCEPFAQAAQQLITQGNLAALHMLCRPAGKQGQAAPAS